MQSNSCLPWDLGFMMEIICHFIMPCMLIAGSSPVYKRVCQILFSIPSIQDKLLISCDPSATSTHQLAPGLSCLYLRSFSRWFWFYNLHASTRALLFHGYKPFYTQMPSISACKSRSDDTYW